MAEIKLPRLLGAAKEFNIGQDTLIEFLVGKGFDRDELKPTAKLTPEMYEALQHNFQGDKNAKSKADQIEIPKSVQAERKRKEDEEITFRKDEPKQATPEAAPKPAEVAVPEVSAGLPELAEPVMSEEKAEEPEVVDSEPEVIKIEAPEIEGPKIIDKIDLSAVGKPKKIEKQSPPVEEAQPPAEDIPEKTVVEDQPEVLPQEEESPAATEDELVVIQNIRAERIEGPKVLGKISLPVENDTRPKPGPAIPQREEKRKRKRIPIDKKGVGGNQPSGDRRPDGQQQPRPPHGGGGDNRFRRDGGGNRGHHPQRSGGNRDNRRPPVQHDREIDPNEIKRKIQETQAILSGSAGKGKSKAKYRREKRNEAAESAAESETNKLQVTEFVTVSDLANLMDVSFADIISKCMSLGIMVSINQRLDAEVIELVAGEFNYEVEFIGLDDAEEEDEEIEDEEEDLLPRAPIVTIMGHVDHGKTSLLDYIRSANVVAGEAGGITQHIGAYQVTIDGDKKITFLDTPGHEAFTAMRARGAKAADVAVIVIAADDAVMPQTKEAISHAQAANLPMIFAINKIDKEGANPTKIYEQLSQMNILVEEWGGKYQSQEISAKKGLNVDLLLEKILLEADLLNLRANPNREASGTIIEASLDKGRGYVATVLVQNGTLKQSDLMVSGQYFGRLKALTNERNQRVTEAPPSAPVQILGLNGAPQAGEKFKIYADESEAKDVATRRSQIIREQGLRTRKHITLDEIGRRLALGNFKELQIIIKGDVDGSVEALSDSLQKLSTEEIVVNVVHKAVGQISESDVLLATASDAIIIGFNVRPSSQASRLAQSEGVEIKTYSIIYNAIEEVKSAMEGMLEPKVEEKEVATVEIREVYKFDKATVAGCYVQEGKVKRDSKVRLFRDGILIYPRTEGAFAELGSLKRFKDDVKEVASGYECGLTIKNFSDINPADTIVAYEKEEVKRTL
ncbi:translation initiation factor IF-2 [Parafilimonas sp.]|uniref:translation initiation factor IF-2 n=1 Tax=Parafilimonas sp. TaxID=1969739 RepID=UPI0039E2CF5B